ncbi:hypothetical protein B7463_g8667, partial [Scytalidium lignicola]
MVTIPNPRVWSIPNGAFWARSWSEWRGKDRVGSPFAWVQLTSNTELCDEAAAPLASKPTTNNYHAAVIGSPHHPVWHSRPQRRGSDTDSLDVASEYPTRLATSAKDTSLLLHPSVDPNPTTWTTSCRELKRRRIVQPTGEHDVEDSIEVSVPSEERSPPSQLDLQSNNNASVASGENSKTTISSNIDLAIIRAREALILSTGASNMKADNRPSEILTPRTNTSQDTLISTIAGTTDRHSPKVDASEGGSGRNLRLDSQLPNTSITSPSVTRSAAIPSFQNPIPPTSFIKDEDTNFPGPKRGKRTPPSHSRLLSEPHNLSSRIAVGNANHNHPSTIQTTTSQNASIMLSPQLSHPGSRIPALFSSISDPVYLSKADSYQETSNASPYPARPYSRASDQLKDQGTSHLGELLPHQSGDTVANMQLPPLQLPITIKGSFNKNQSRSKGPRTGSRFDTTAKVLLRQRPRPQQHRANVDSDTLLSLPIGVLMSRELAPFFEWYCFKANAINIGLLKFELLDVDWQPAKIMFISRGDNVGYSSLKTHISNLFYMALNRSPNMAEFRISVSPDGDSMKIKSPSLLARLPERLQRPDSPTESAKQKGMSQDDQRQPFLGEIMSPMNGSDTKPSMMKYPSHHNQESASPISTLNGFGEFSSRNPSASNRRDSYSTPRGFINSDLGVSSSHPPGYISHTISNSSDQLSAQVHAHHPPRSFSESSDHTLPEIVVLLQQSDGKLSQPYQKDVLHPRISSAEFFSWFGTYSGFGTSGIPSELRFTFKDALPVPKTSLVARGNEDHFNYMRADIKRKCEKAKWFRPEIKEFVVLVTLPGWETEGAEEVDW